MSTQIQRRRGTTAEHSTFTGVEGELTVDTTKDTAVVHDGTTVGGHPLQKQYPPLGSAAAPTYTFTGDNNTGIYSPGADQVAVATNGAGRLFVDASGKVGVGIASPGNILAVAENKNGISIASIENTNAGNNTQARFKVSNGTHSGSFGVLGTGFTPIGVFSAGDTFVYSESSAAGGGLAIAGDIIKFATGGTTERLRITSAGLVGIGTSSPDSKLTVADSEYSPIEIKSNRTTATDNLGGLHFKTVSTDVAYIQSLVDGTLKFRNTSSLTERLRITSAGLVGIGTTSPTHNLTIGSTAASDFVLSLRGGVGGFLGWDDSANCTILQAPNTRSLQFRVNSDTFSAGTMAMHINSSGNVGIGTTSPARILDVAGSADFAVPNGQGIRLGYRGETKTAYIGIDANDTYSVNQSWANSCWIGFESGASDKNILYRTNSNHIFYGANAAERARIDSSGRLLVGTSTDRNVGGHNAKLQVEDTGYGATLQSVRNVNGVDGAYLFLGKSRGTTLGSNTIVQSGDELGNIRFYGADGSTMRGAAEITCRVDGTPGAGDMPGLLTFSVTQDGSASPTERARLTSTGEWRVYSSGNDTLLVGNAAGSGTTQSLFTGIHTRTSTTGGGTVAYRIYNNGTTFSVSDARQKKNVETARDGYLEDLQQLRVVKYNWIDQADTESKELGLLAQEVAQVFPGLVQSADPSDPESTLGIKSSVFSFMLIKALQEAGEKIEALETRLAALEAQ